SPSATASITSRSGSASCRRRTFPWRSRVARCGASRSICIRCTITSPMKSWSAAQRARRWRQCPSRSTRSSPGSRAGLPTSSKSPMSGWWKWAFTSRSKLNVVPRPRRLPRNRNGKYASLAGSAEMLHLICHHSRAQIAAMGQEPEQARHGLDALTGAAREASRKGPPPVHLWNPPFCGDLDMRIASDGTWFYLKTPIGRAALVKLFASVLKREGDKYFLVTPVEKCGIIVEDAPFLAVELRAEQAAQGRMLYFRTNV